MNHQSTQTNPCASLLKYLKEQKTIYTQYLIEPENQWYVHKRLQSTLKSYLMSQNAPNYVKFNKPNFQLTKNDINNLPYLHLLGKLNEIIYALEIVTSQQVNYHYPTTQVTYQGPGLFHRQYPQADQHWPNNPPYCEKAYRSY